MTPANKLKQQFTLLTAAETQSVTLTTKNPGRKTGRRKIPVKLLKQKPEESLKVCGYSSHGLLYITVYVVIFHMVC